MKLAITLASCRKSSFEKQSLRQSLLKPQIKWKKERIYRPGHSTPRLQTRSLSWVSVNIHTLPLALQDSSSIIFTAPIQICLALNLKALPYNSLANVLQLI